MKNTERIRFIGGRHVINSAYCSLRNEMERNEILIEIQILILSKQKEHCYLHLNYAWPKIPSFAVLDHKIEDQPTRVFSFCPKNLLKIVRVFNVHRHGGPKHQVFFVNGTKIVEQALSYFVCFSKSLGLCTKIVHELPTFRFWNFFKRSHSIESFWAFYLLRLCSLWSPEER